MNRFDTNSKAAAAEKRGGLTLIIGGAYQGKLTHAVHVLEFDKQSVFNLAALSDCSTAALRSAVCRSNAAYTHFEALTRKIAAECGNLPAAVELIEADFLEPLSVLSEKIPIALISREIGCGIVPLSEEDRLWREVHGAALARAAARADSVTRIFCGLPERLK